MDPPLNEDQHQQFVDSDPSSNSASTSSKRKGKQGKKDPKKTTELSEKPSRHTRTTTGGSPLLTGLPATFSSRARTVQQVEREQQEVSEVTQIPKKTKTGGEDFYDRVHPHRRHSTGEDTVPLIDLTSVTPPPLTRTSLTTMAFTPDAFFVAPGANTDALTYCNSLSTYATHFTNRSASASLDGGRDIFHQGTHSKFFGVMGQGSGNAFCIVFRTKTADNDERLAASQTFWSLIKTVDDFNIMVGAAVTLARFHFYKRHKQVATANDIYPYLAATFFVPHTLAQSFIFFPDEVTDYKKWTFAQLAAAIGMTEQNLEVAVPGTDTAAKKEAMFNNVVMANLGMVFFDHMKNPSKMTLTIFLNVVFGGTGKKWEQTKLQNLFGGVSPKCSQFDDVPQLRDSFVYLRSKPFQHISDWLIYMEEEATNNDCLKGVEIIVKRWQTNGTAFATFIFKTIKDHPNFEWGQLETLYPSEWPSAVSAMKAIVGKPMVGLDPSVMTLHSARKYRGIAWACTQLVARIGGGTDMSSHAAFAKYVPNLGAEKLINTYITARTNLVPAGTKPSQWSEVEILLNKF